MTTPHPSYLMTLVAGALDTKYGDWNGLPLIYSAPEGLGERLLPSLDATAGALEFLTEITGRRYPYTKYGQACVENFPFGGMENISATTLTATTLRDEHGLVDRNNNGLVVHEAAHQWFGDLLTCADWSHIWLNEGFATYMNLLYIERTEGQDAFRVAMRDTQETYLMHDAGETRRPIVTTTWIDPIDIFFGGHTYQGGASRLHLLRYVLGDDAFFRGVRMYVGRNAGRGVVTDDLRAAMEEASGQDLEGFFDQWLYSAGFPEFNMHWRYDESRERVLVTVNQEHSVEGVRSVFETPVDIEVRTASGAVTHRAEVTRRRQIFEFPSKEAPTWVRFDKGGWLPARKNAKKKLNEWLTLAARDDDVNGRRDALRRLRAIGAEKETPEDRARIRAALLHALTEDASDAVRAASASLLDQPFGADVQSALATAARSDESLRVRRAALGALAQWGANAELTTLGQEAYDARDSWDTMGAAAELVVAADPLGAFTWLLERLNEDSPHGVLRGHLLGHLGGLEGAGVRRLLFDWASNTAAEQPVRVVAVQQLAAYAGEFPVVRDLLIDLLDTDLARLRRAAVEGLAALRDEVAIRALAEHYKVCVSPREKRAIEAALRLE
jgi:aminopeptidase N